MFLGKGDAASVSAGTGISKDLVEQIRKDVLYWYPLDLNLGGKEHMTVHFPAFLMNHVAILPKELWPRGIMVNWYITGKKNAATGKGDKISKSKGGAQPIPGAAEKFGVDGLRFYYAHIASPFADVEWVEETVYSYRQKLDRIISFVGELNEMAEDGPEGEIDRWIISRINGHVKVIRDAMDKLDLRQLATTTYFDMVNDIRWYVRRGGKNKATIRKILRTWINAMMPVTPHTAEELWAQSGFDGMVSEAQFPEYDESLFSADAEYGENLVRDVIADSAQIIKVTGIQPKRVVIYTASAWKRKVMDNAVALLKEGKLDIPGLTKRCMADEELRKNGKAVSDLAKKIAADYMRSTVDKAEPVACTDETALLSSASGFMSDEIGFGIEVFNADAEGIYDPKGKSKVAIPGRPAIYIE